MAAREAAVRKAEAKCAAAEQSLKEERGKEGSFHQYQQVLSLCISSLIYDSNQKSAGSFQKMMNNVQHWAPFKNILQVSRDYAQKQWGPQHTPVMRICTMHG